MSKVQISSELRQLFPNDPMAVKASFTLALWHEQEGDYEKADDYLIKAIEAEEEAKQI